MEDTRVLHLSKSFSFSKEEILFIDNDAQSAISLYVCANLNNIKRVCQAYGYEFYFMPEEVRNMVTRLSTEQKHYYSPWGNEELLPVEIGTDYLVKFCKEEDKQLVSPALFRFNDYHNQARLWLLKPIEETPFEEQLKAYLQLLKAQDQRDIESRSDGIRFSISDNRKISPFVEFMAGLPTETILADENFDVETQVLVKEVLDRIGMLRLKGVEEDMLHSLIDKQVKLSRLVVTNDFRIVLPDYGDMEIVMSPLPKAVFLLFLRHEEGIPFKYLSDYRDELKQIYMQLTNRVQTFVIHKSLDDVCDPTKNAINEKCARIREAFVGKFDDCLARNYYITGNRGEAKRVTLPRNLVTWD